VYFTTKNCDKMTSWYFLTHCALEAVFLAKKDLSNIGHFCGHVCGVDIQEMWVHAPLVAKYLSL